MRIVAATGDHVDKCMKAFSSRLYNDVISEKQRSFLEKFLCFPSTDILSANYSLELEQAAGIPHQKNKYYAARRDTKECSARERRLRMYTYFEAEKYKKRIWHIHGDVTAPSSIIMGHYYYGKLLHEIQNYIPDLMRRSGDVSSYKPKSWVDLFLLNEIHMIGFGLNLSEIDLWWLICCKRRYFSHTKIVFHKPFWERCDEAALMMRTYGVTVCDDTEAETGNYLSYYEKVLDRIRNS